MPQCFIALGGNMGDVAAAFDQALSRLDAQPGIAVRQVSRTFRTEPVGSAAGTAYLNAAAELDCRLTPVQLLDALQREESLAGRVREYRWSPRPLDLDLLLYGRRLILHPRLIVPHPALWYRRFVLDPLAEIAADVIHPVKRLSVAALRHRLLPRPLPVVLTGGCPAFRENLAATLSARFPQAEIDANRSPCEPATLPSADPPAPALAIWLGPQLPDASCRNSGRAALELLPRAARLDATVLPEPREESVADVLAAALG